MKNSEKVMQLAKEREKKLLKVLNEIKLSDNDRLWCRVCAIMDFLDEDQRG